MKKGKFITILCFMFILLLCPFSIFAEDPELGDVSILTDGTHSDHQVITSCPVGEVITIDIGSYDTAYLNDDFSVNAAIGNKVTFTCQSYNDIKLAYYGINSTVYVSYENKLTDALLETLSTYDFDAENVIVSGWKDIDYISISSTISNFNSSTGSYDYSGFDVVYSDGSHNYNPASGTSTINGDDRYVYFLKFNDEIIFNGLPFSVTGYYKITSTVDPTNSGYVTGSGSFKPNTYTTLTAYPNEGYVFDHWLSGSTNNNLTVYVTGNENYVAYFVPEPVTTTYTVTATVSPEGYGYVDGTGTYTSGSLVTVSAHAYDGYIFKEWNTGSTSNYLTFNINENRDYIAYFEVDPNYTPPEEETITVSGSVAPINSGYIQGLGEYEPGADITLTAVANDGYTFVQWDNGNTLPTRIINSMSDINVTAYFVSNDASSSSLLLEEQYIILDYICNGNTSYTYRQNVSIVKAPNMNVYASLPTSDDYRLIAENVNEFVISGISETKSSDACYFLPYIENSRTVFLSDGVTIGSDDGLVVYKFVLTEKHDPIVDGSSESNLATDKNEAQNAELDSVITEYNEIEGQFKDNLDTSLNDIDFSFDFGNITDFSTSANFVRSQFDNLTNNPFGSLVGFSLAVGLALLIMGRRL